MTGIQKLQKKLKKIEKQFDGVENQPLRRARLMKQFESVERQIKRLKGGK